MRFSEFSAKVHFSLGEVLSNLVKIVFPLRFFRV